MPPTNSAKHSYHTRTMLMSWKIKYEEYCGKSPTEMEDLQYSDVESMGLMSDLPPLVGLVTGNTS